MFGFHYLLDEFIQTILISDFLNFVYEDANTQFEIIFILKTKQAFNLLRETMVNKGITILVHDDLFIGGTSNNEPVFEVFRFKQKEFISIDDLFLKLGNKYTPLCSQLTYEADIRIAKQQILERWKNVKIVRNKVKTEPSIKIALIACMQTTKILYLSNIFIICMKLNSIGQVSDENDSSYSARDPAFLTTLNVQGKLS